MSEAADSSLVLVNRHTGERLSLWRVARDGEEWIELKGSLPPLLYLAHVAVRHRRTQAVLLMPLPLQAVFFRALVGIGTLLGRYRGDDWPGSPARCPGAPPARS